MIKIAFFQTHKYEEKKFAELAKSNGVEIIFLEPRLTAQTAILAKGCNVVCSFVNDQVDEDTLNSLKEHTSIKLLALRSAGFNHVDIEYATKLDIPVVRVPYYSPNAIAEHTICLLLALNRKVHKAHMRIQSLNFSLDGLVGFDLAGKTVGVIGTGAIGSRFVKIMKGFNCNVLAYDKFQNDELKDDCTYVSLEKLIKESDVISLHIPLNTETKHIINKENIQKAKKGVIIINTSRGALIDTRALIDGLKTTQVGGAGLDVYEEEESIFFEDLSDQVLQDDVLARLISFPNVLITSHQAFLTNEALAQIAGITMSNITEFFSSGKINNQVKNL